MVKTQLMIKDISDDFDILEFSNVFNGILSPELVQLITDYISKLKSRYRVLEYSYIPFYADEDITDVIYCAMLASHFYLKIEKYLFLFEEVNSNTLLKYNNLVGGNKRVVTDNKTIDINHSKTGENTFSDVHSGSDTTENSSTSNSMSENAPINSNIESIDTPDVKNAGKSTLNSTLTKGTKKDTTEKYDTTDSDSGTNNRELNEENINPQLFEMFSEYMETHNLYTIIDKCYRRVIHEFNKSI